MISAHDVFRETMSRAYMELRDADIGATLRILVEVLVDHLNAELEKLQPRPGDGARFLVEYEGEM